MRDGLHVDARNRSTSFKPGSESSLGGISALELGSIKSEEGRPPTKE